MPSNTTQIQTLFQELTQHEQLTLVRDLMDQILTGTPQSGTPLQIRLEVRPANNGDTLVLSYENQDGQIRNLWVDGGLVKSYQEHHQAYLKKLLSAGGKLDLMVVTHIDQDHIGGILAFCNDASLPAEMVKQFWFNSGLMISKYFNTPEVGSRALDMPKIGENSRSLKQGITFEEFLQQNGNWHDSPIMAGQIHDFGDAHLTILTPNEDGLHKLNEEWQEELSDVQTRAGRDYDKDLSELAAKTPREDRSIANESSIAFIFSLGNIRLLMLGDAHSSDVARSLKGLGYSKEKKISLDAVKLSHHGSKASNTYDLLDLIDCQKFIISTDGSRHGLPNKEAMARIILHPDRDNSKPITFVFNFNNDTLQGIFTPEEMATHNFRCEFPPTNNEGIALDWTARV